jgi:hypothetical protein
MFKAEFFIILVLKFVMKFLLKFIYVPFALLIFMILGLLLIFYIVISFVTDIEGKVYLFTRYHHFCLLI